MHTMTPEELRAWCWNRRDLCTLQVTERMVYDAPKPYVHFDRLALVHQDGTVLYEGSTEKGDTFWRVAGMQRQIVLNA
jgi:hypothetical protein